MRAAVGIAAVLAGLVALSAAAQDSDVTSPVIDAEIGEAATEGVAADAEPRVFTGDGDALVSEATLGAIRDGTAVLVSADGDVIGAVEAVRAAADGARAYAVRVSDDMPGAGTVVLIHTSVEADAEGRITVALPTEAIRAELENSEG